MSITDMQNKRIMTVMLEWDYGNPARGDSDVKIWFHNNFKHYFNQVDPFWYDQYIHGSTDNLQKEILDYADKIKPDLIFFFPYTHQFKTETLQQLKKHYQTIAWFGDDQWRFEDFSSVYAPHFGHVVTTDPWAVPKYEKIGVKPILSQWAGQLYTDPRPPYPADHTFKYDVSFIGGTNPVRRWFVKQLNNAGINVQCFGQGWPNGKVSDQEMENIFRESKINLNLSNSVSYDARYLLSNLRNILTTLRSPKNVEQIKARHFEIPVAGGFELSYYIPGIENVFEVGKEIVCYSSIEDCIQLIQYYLAHDQERYAIAKKGYQRAISSHTYDHRIKEIFQSLWNQ
jgi:spore maturation protein CgeB